jgi:hypothetical protein
MRGEYRAQLRTMKNTRRRDPAMNNKALCIAVLMVWGVAGCASPGKDDSGSPPRGDHHGRFKPTKNPPPRTPHDLDCRKGGACDAEITVEVSGDWCRAKAANPTIRVAPDNDDMDITWVLKAPAGYSFPPRDGPPGVFIKGPNDGTFKLKSSSPTTFVLKNKRQSAKTQFYDYGVFVYDVNRKYLCDLLDPVIVNEM